MCTFWAHSDVYSENCYNRLIDGYVKIVCVWCVCYSKIHWQCLCFIYKSDVLSKWFIWLIVVATLYGCSFFSSRSSSFPHRTNIFQIDTKHSYDVIWGTWHTGLDGIAMRYFVCLFFFCFKNSTQFSTDLTIFSFHYIVLYSLLCLAFYIGSPYTVSVA